MKIQTKIISLAIPIILVISLFTYSFTYSQYQAQAQLPQIKAIVYDYTIGNVNSTHAEITISFVYFGNGISDFSSTTITISSIEILTGQTINFRINQAIIKDANNFRYSLTNADIIKTQFNIGV